MVEISDLKLEERETHINMTANDRSHWIVYSDDPVTQGWVEKIDHDLIAEHHGGGKTYRIGVKQLRFRNPRKLSPAQLEAARRNIELAHEAQ